MYYNEDVKDILKRLNTSKEGLSSKDALNRLNEYGLNEINVQKRKSKILIFLSEFNDTMIIILLISAIICFIIYILNK